MKAHLELAGGGEAALLAANANAVVLRSTVASPPGSRVEGVLAGEPGTVVRIKVHACRRQEDGSFLVEGRPLDLTRPVRDKLEALVAERGASR